jgi:methylmalonyl-CoA/ethylmalonyl-CoA epimerase
MSSSTPRGTRISHLGIAVSSLEAVLPFYRDVLGMPETPIDNADGAQIRALVAGEALVELMEPMKSDSPVGKFLTKRGPGLHHICFSVDDIDAALARCKAHGVQLIDEVPRIGAEGKRIAFLHPKSTAGVLVELSEY